MEFRSRRPVHFIRQSTTSARSTNASRRLSFQPSGLSRPSVSSFYSRTSTGGPNDVFIPDSPERSDHETIPVWQPGQTIPVAPQPQEDLRALLQEMQHTIESNFSELKGKISELDSRIATVEENQKELQQSAPSSSSEDSPSGRKRRNPAELQHQIRAIYSSLSEKLKLDERIDSEHNRKIVASIKKELESSPYSERQIQDGCRTYRKSLRGQRNGRSELEMRRVRIRARQQRLYEKRGRVVKDRESVVWKDVAPNMMSEEETEDEGFIRHGQGWKSRKFVKFLTKLDNRIAKKGKSGIPAWERSYGVSVNAPIPSTVKPWMTTTCNESESPDENPCRGSELFPDGDED